MSRVRSDLVVDPMSRQSMLDSMKLKQESAQRAKVAKEDAYWDKHKAGRADRLKRGRERTAKMTPKPVKTTPEVTEGGGGNKAAYMQAAASVAGGGGGGGNGTSTAGGAMMSAGAATGNAPLMAAGGVLTVIGSVQAKKEAAEQKKADNENTRRRNVQQAMAQLGSGIGSIGMA